MTKDMDLAADLTAETFTIAIVMLDIFSWQNRTFGVWLARIARNLVTRDSYRRKVRREVWFDPKLHDRAGGARPDHEVERRVEAKILGECLECLDPGWLCVFERHYFEGQTVREIAMALGVSEPAVKSRLQRGRRLLRIWMIERGISW